MFKKIAALSCILLAKVALADPGIPITITIDPDLLRLKPTITANVFNTHNSVNPAEWEELNSLSPHQANDLATQINGFVSVDSGSQTPIGVQVVMSYIDPHAGARLTTQKTCYTKYVYSEPKAGPIAISYQADFVC